MKKLLPFTLTLALGMGLLVTGCSSNGNGGDAQEKRVVNVCSWGEYIDQDLITQFEDETGITVNYQTESSNETLYARLQTGGTNFDVVVPSDYMISQLIQEDMLSEVNYENVPNYALIDDTYKGLPFDPDNKYTVPYTFGTLGIIYNPEMTGGEIDSWDAMFDTKYAGDVLMISNPRDAMGIALMSMGYSVNTTDETEIRAAHQKLATAKADGVYQAWVMDEVFDKMESGEAAIAAYYAGDYLSMLENNENLRFVVPEDGSNFFVDAMCIMKDAANKDEAEEWMNFMASTEASIANMDYIQYASPNGEARDQYPAYYEETYGEALDMELFNIMATPADIIKTCEAYLVLPEETNNLYKDLWISLGI